MIRETGDILIPIYSSFLLNIIIGKDLSEEEIKLIESRYDSMEISEDDLAFVCKTNNKDNRKVIVAYFSPDHKSGLTLGIVAHEAVHIKNQIFGAIGLKSTSKNDEAEAYFVEYLVDRIVEFLKSNNVKL